MSLTGILLAAGQSSRFGGNKLLAPLSGEPLAVHACRHLIAAVPDVVVVVRPDDAILRNTLQALGARIIECANADCGMGVSLASGVQATINASGWIVALADMPWIRIETIAKVAAAIAAGASIVAPYYRGQRGHPVAFAKSYGAALASLQGDEGAKYVLAQNLLAITRIDVDDPGVLRDIDTPADLAE